MLAVLASLPFTSPFSTCNLGLFVAGRVVHRNAPSEGPSRGPSIADAVFFLASIGDVEEALKNLAEASTARQTIAFRTASSRTVLWVVSRARATVAPVSSPVLRI